MFIMFTLHDALIKFDAINYTKLPREDFKIQTWFYLHWMHPMAIRNDHLHSSAWPGGRDHHDQGTTNQIHIYNGQSQAFISSFLVPFNGSKNTESLRDDWSEVTVTFGVSLQLSEEWFTFLQRHVYKRQILTFKICQIDNPGTPLEEADYY